MEGVGEEEWVVTKDKEKGINIHILLFQKRNERVKSYHNRSLFLGLQY